jgi:hypothetical protein
MKQVLAAALCAAMLAHAPAAAQAPNLEILPRIGMSMPLGTLADNTEIDMALALGVTAELVLPRLPFNLRANLDYGRAADIVQRTTLEPVLGSASILAIVGDVVLRPLPPTAFAQPYFVAGGGITRYEIEIGPVADTRLRTGTTTRATFHIGGGFDVSVGPLSLVLQVSDYISTFPDEGGSRLQNHVFGTIGFRVAMF